MSGRRPLLARARARPAWAVLRGRDFRWLFATRLTSQCADGVFQASLGSAVFFNPEHRTTAAQAAAGFAVLLLPYSLVGPFAGVFLDRWRRQRVLVVANLVRALIVCAVAALLVLVGPTGPLFYATALAAVSVNRFYLSALSAALPHVVRRDQLVLANAISTTTGSLLTAAGAGLGLGLRAVVGAGDSGNAVIALAAAGTYLLSAATATGSDPALLGPDSRPAVATRRAILAVFGGLAAGTRHVLRQRAAAYALLAIGAHRFCYGISTVATLLLYRNYAGFTDSGPFRTGLVGLGQVVACGTAGAVLAAVVTPAVTVRISKPVWIAVLFAMASAVEVGLGLPYTQPALLVAAFLLGITAQGSKVCVDTIVQEVVDDGFRGRVFSLYDMLFNLTFVSAAACAALTLPANGKSYPVLAGIAAGYAATAVTYGLASLRTRGRPVAAEPAERLTSAGR